MNAPAKDIKDFIVSEDSSLEDIIYLGRMPAKPDNCITIFDTFGNIDLVLNREEKYERPGIQIQVRNREYQAGFAVAETLKDMLHGRAETINETSYTLIRCMNSPSSLGWDDNNRHIFALNFILHRR